MTRSLAAAVAALTVLGLTLTPACERSATKPAAAAPVETYTTRGRVEGVSNRPGAETLLQIHHEEIPTFKNREGRVIGMKEMVMDFPIAKGVSVEGLSVGTLVEVEFAVDWSKVPYHVATRLTRLPADTPMRLGSFEDPAAGHGARGGTGTQPGAGAKPPAGGK
jgi:Cu/Ag efflux protein CusF